MFKDNKEKNFESLKSIMGKLSKNLNLDRGYRVLTFVNIWPNLIGYKFKDKTKVLSIKQNGIIDVVVVSVSSSAVSQELYMIKDIILNRLTSISLSLKFNIKDIVFTTNGWSYKDDEKTLLNDDNIHFLDKNPTNEDLKDINIPENIMESILKSINAHNFTSNTIKERILNTITSDIKTQIWRKNNGFPFCEKCGISMNYYYEDQKLLCPSCKYSK